MPRRVRRRSGRAVDAAPLAAPSGAAASPAAFPAPRRSRRARGEVVLFPRRAAGANLDAAATLPPMEAESVRPSVLRAAWRVLWLAVRLAFFGLASFFDWLTFDWRNVLRGRAFSRQGAVVHRRAVRLRHLLQSLGGTFIKIGQQLSIRADVLPPVYCNELEQLLDNAEPIPVGYVRRILSCRSGGRPVEEVFESFDFEPIGRASIACVYKARLKGSGRTVAVKVRRPDIVRHFKTDLAALDWVLRTAEFLTLLRPGITETFRFELRTMLLEELDFRIEARYQELFRRYFKKRPNLRTTAPRIHYRLSGRDVIVSDYVTGVWMKELMGGVGAGDKAYLAALKAVDIDPAVVARRLIRGSHYGFFECPFFHGDPHPGNIVVQRGNRMVFVDFGACGVFAQRERDLLALMHRFHSREDVGGMVYCVIGLMEPLPPIDVDMFRRELEDAWWKGFYGVKSRHAEWWERTSFRLWSTLLRLVRKYRVPLPLSVLRMIRATLLYDTVAARIYPDIDVFREYRKYYKSYARRVTRRVQRSLLRQLFHGPDYANYVRLARLWDVGNLLLDRAQLLLQRPTPSFSALVSKGYEVATATIKWLLMTAGLTLAAGAAGVAVVARRFRDDGALWLYPGRMWGEMVREMADPQTGPLESIAAVWIVAVLGVALKYLRQMWFRLDDKDHG